MSHGPRVNDTPAVNTAPTTAGRSIALVAAVASNGVIGSRNQLPWRIPDDLRRFRALTLGHAIVMGRRTWESIGKPLPGRQNIVLTRDPDLRREDIDFVPSLADAVAIAKRPEPIFVIGGEAVYAAALPVARRLYLTEIHRPFDGEARFPSYDRAAWRECSREQCRLDGPDGFGYDFAVYDRLAL
jgi:dihydrofolate reductase